MCGWVGYKLKAKVQEMGELLLVKAGPSQEGQGPRATQVPLKSM